jgi:hypothetical protein
MARRSNDSTGEDKAKVRVLFAEIEGNNETVQEALRTMISAMSRPVRIVHVKANGETPTLTQQDVESDSVDEVLDRDSFSEESSQSETNGGRKPRGSGPKTDRNAGIALVHDLDFRPQGHPALREFFAEKDSGNDMENILVVLFYMQHTIRVSKIGLGHIRTALADVKKSIPLDLRQTIRNMRDRKAWVKYSELDDITTATAGDNQVLHDMGKKS